MLRPPAPSRPIAVLITGAVVLAFGMVVAPTASATPGPVVPRPGSAVTADSLPTVQVDGVVWSQAVVGNTVYAGGNFTSARPAGSPAGQNTTTRNNLLAYNLTTGRLIDSFAPSLNGQVQSVAASPDGSRVYVGGDFTSVSGVTRSRIAAFSTSTGALVASFNVSLGSRVKAIVATNSTVYVGGQFTSANGQPRERLAAFNAANGALLGWNPGADYTVNALVLTPDGSRIIAGGAFQNVAGQPAYGLASISLSAGTLLPWAATQKIQDAGVHAAITSLSTDGTAVYGTGYVFGSGGNLEGAFSARPDSGTINWIEDCHGDTYSAFSTGQTVYTVSHAHYCSNLGGFLQSDPTSTNMRHAVAFTATATGTLNHDPFGYTDFFGNPSPSMVDWFPDLAIGSFTGQNQAAWSLAGNSQYVVVGGEFPTVNGVGQQGLARFAVTPIAPAKRGPVVTGAKFTPGLLQAGPHTVRVAFDANWDQDDMTLTYKVVRNSDTVAPRYTATVDSTFWNRPGLGFIDQLPATDLAGTTYRYRLYVTDAAGNQVAGDTVTITTAAPTTLGSYAQLVVDQGATTYWRLGEGSGSLAIDHVGYNDGRVSAGVTRGTSGAITGDADTASTFNGTPTGLVATQAPTTGPNTFTIEAWFKTTTTSGGKIIGFGNLPVGNSNFYDRQLYMDNSGRIWFGVNNGATRMQNTAQSYNDGKWHQVVGTLGPNGMNLYVDGTNLATRSDVTTAEPGTGYWRVGGDNLKGWAFTPTSAYLDGAIDEVSIYPTVLAADQVHTQYLTATTSSPAAAPAG